MKYLFTIIALTISLNAQGIPEHPPGQGKNRPKPPEVAKEIREERSEEHTSELQSH